MIKTKIQKNTQGFTLVEVVVSVMILSTALAAILTLSANSIFAIRYSKNRIIATQLLQESLETVRNIRDNAKQQGTNLVTLSNAGGAFNPCFNANGCYTDLFTTNPTIQILSCPSGVCPQLYLSNASSSTPNVYSINKNDGTWFATEQQYTRKITMTSNDANNTVIVTGTITWYDKGVLKSMSQGMILSNWSL